MKRAPIKKAQPLDSSSKARRQQSTNQVRKDRRQKAVHAKRRRVNSAGSKDEVVVPKRTITELVSALADPKTKENHAQCFQILKEIRALLSVHERDYEVIDAITDSGIVTVLVELLNSASPLSSATRTGGEVYRELLWILTNVASGQYHHTKQVLPAATRLLEFIESSNLSLAEHAAWVIGNIAADCDEFRLELISMNAIRPLQKPLTAALEASESMTATATESRGLVATCAWALSNLARSNDPRAATAEQFTVDNFVTTLVAAFRACLPESSDTVWNAQVGVELAWLLSFLTAREESVLKTFETIGLHHLVLTKMEDALALSNELLLTPMLRILGNFCCMDTDRPSDGIQSTYVREIIHDKRFIPVLSTFIHPGSTYPTHLVAESCWVVSTLAALNAEMVAELVKEPSLLASLVHHVSSNGSFEVKKEAAFALGNIMLTTPTYLSYMDTVLVSYLQCLQATDMTLVSESLRVVDFYLREGGSNAVLQVEREGGIDALETVQFESGNEELAQHAVAIVNEFYGEEYGVNSPVGQNAMPTTFDFTETTPSVGSGRGRGAHLTTPAWKK